MIQPHPSAPDGTVITLSSYSPTTFCSVGRESSTILCRNSAPLVAFAYGLLQRDIPCIILGRDIGKALTDLVKKMRAVGLADLRDKLGVWVARESSKAESEGRDPERITDQYACLMFFIRNLDEMSQTIESLVAKIDLMFTDEATASGRIILSTVHKAKGLEYDTVFILDRHLIPSKYAKRPEQQRQERNLMYVAITRARLHLRYITSDCWKASTLKEETL